MKNALWVVVFVVLVAVFVGIAVLRKGGTRTSHRIGVIPKETESVYWEGVRQGALKAGAGVAGAIGAVPASYATAAGTRHLIIATLTESFTTRHDTIA